MGFGSYTFSLTHGIKIEGPQLFSPLLGFGSAVLYASTPGVKLEVQILYRSLIPACVIQTSEVPGKSLGLSIYVQCERADVASF